jgi:hypothetical protein
MNNKPSWRAVRLAGLGAGLALLLGACGEPTTEGQQQGQMTPPASTDQATTTQ